MILGSNAEGEKRLITRERFIPLLLDRYKVYSIIHVYSNNGERYPSIIILEMLGNLTKCPLSAVRGWG